jgi:S-adenosylmethionine:tRNA ribosyltransferase-isomerase
VLRAYPAIIYAVRIEDLDYELPEAAIAQSPLVDRASSKLLCLDRLNGTIQDRTFRDVVEILHAGDLLVLNNTRVTALRLLGEKTTGGKVEVLLLKDLGHGSFEALAKPGKRLKPRTVIQFDGALTATVEEELQGGQKLICFSADPELDAKLKLAGEVPLPPYIKGQIENTERYQTVYATAGGSAAAPTAGLHFTPQILTALANKGIETAWVTLDVGLDTFRPITSEDPLSHQMHGETCHLPAETAIMVSQAKGRIIAVGTTAVRTLETFAIDRRRVEPGSLATKLFITPGYEFRIVDGMFTNFHMPRTTMLLMLSALCGRERIMTAYEHAVHHGYRFLSFGDSMLIL